MDFYIFCNLRGIFRIFFKKPSKFQNLTNFGFVIQSNTTHLPTSDMRINQKNRKFVQFQTIYRDIFRRKGGQYHLNWISFLIWYKFLMRNLKSFLKINKIPSPWSATEFRYESELRVNMKIVTTFSINRNSFSSKFKDGLAYFI